MSFWKYFPHVAEEEQSKIWTEKNTCYLYSMCKLFKEFCDKKIDEEA